MKQHLLSATFDNGITVLGERMPHVESVALAFHVPAGAVHDPPGRCGLASLAGEMCLRGAGDRTGRQVVETLDGTGVQWSHDVSSTHLSLSGAMLPRQLPEVLPVYVDILRRPRLPAAELEPARQMILQDLAGLEDDPTHKVLAALRLMHLPAPWGRPTEGVTADVEAVDLEDVRAFVAERLLPAETIIAVAGRIDWDDFLRRIDALLGDWSGGPGSPVVTGDRGQFLRHVPHDSQQTHIALAWSLPPFRDDDSAIAAATLAILGGSTSSRLFTEVRERRALCYGVSAAYQSHRDFAAGLCHAGTTAARAQETLDVILAELDRLPGSIGTDELDRVKARVASGLVMQQESTGARVGSLARQWYYLGRIRTLEEDLARFDRLDVPTMERWLAARPPRDLSVASLGPQPLEMPGALPA